MATILARFPDGEALLAAVRAMREAGLKDLDTHSPYPLEGASEALGLPRSPVPLMVLIAGLAGAGIAYAVQRYCNAVDWPLNVGGRPPHAAPSFVPITFESGVLFAAVVAFLGLLVLLGFPMPFHRFYRLEAFRSATLTGFWLSAEVEPAGVDAATERLKELGATDVHHLREDDE